LIRREYSPEPVADDIVLLDPVCGMTVDRASARHLAEHEGVVYAFCRMGCRTAFIREPEAYVGVGASIES
jgi:YHS domain-containing protein